MQLLEAIPLIERQIIKGVPHADYERVTALAQTYKALITGEDIEDLLHQFVKREDDEMFAQRVALTKIITPSIAASLMTPYNKVARNDKVRKKIDIKDEGRKKIVEDMLDRFYGNDRYQNGLDMYLRTRFTELTFTDPNAWIVIEFDAFDNTQSFAQPRPFEVTAAEAYNFEYSNDVLQWLLVRETMMVKMRGQPNSFISPTASPALAIDYPEREGLRWILYTDENALVYTEVDLNYITDTKYQLKPNETLVELAKKWYIRAEFEPKIGFVPAFRVGYKRDVYTEGRTYVNPFHPAMPYFLKSVKTVSEMDITMTLHAFPQKIQHVGLCRGTKERACNKGWCNDGSKCEVCGGTGEMIHKTAQDIIKIPMPTNVTNEDMLDLDNIIKYVAPPIDILQFQSDYIDKLEVKAHAAVFNSTVFVTQTNVKTATEKMLDMDSVYDTVAPFAKKTSWCWKFIANICAILSDVPSLDAVEIQHTFPADLKLKTSTMLLEELKLMNDSGAPSFVKESANNDLAAMIYVEDEIELVKYKVKQKFFPFSGKTFDEITLLMESPFVPEVSKVLYANFENIFSEIDMKDITFWLKPYDEQWDIIQLAVKAYIDTQLGEENVKLSVSPTAQFKADTAPADTPPGKPTGGNNPDA